MSEAAPLDGVYTVEGEGTDDMGTRSDLVREIATLQADLNTARTSLQQAQESLGESEQKYHDTLKRLMMVEEFTSRDAWALVESTRLRDEALASLAAKNELFDKEQRARFELIADTERAEEALGEIRAVVDRQAKDEGLWSLPLTEGTQPIVEAYLQQELRSLHAVVESRCAALSTEADQ
jgi:hypothetical protein